MNRFLTLTALMAAAILPAQADVYKCIDAKGQTTFSQMPCAKNAEKVTIKTFEPTEDQAAHTRAANEQNRALSAAGESSRGLQAAHNRVKKLIDERDSQLAVLKHKKLYANNNLAGATWEKSISDEMQAVSTRYNADIAAARDHVRDLEKQAEDKENNKR
ncbi:MAG: DUF4124 domain-containing protein [Halothiobacillus sp.]